MATYDRDIYLNSNDYTSAADKAYSIICEKILSGDLTPGTRLTRRAMAELTGVSIIPVIDALHRLEAEGLAESLPYLGTNVIRLNDETIRNKMALRLAVESQVARIISHTRFDGNKESFAVRGKDLDTKLAIGGFNRENWELHFQFHIDMARLTEIPSLVNTTRDMQLFLLMIWKDQASNQGANDYDTHSRLVENVFAQSADTASHAARRHIASSGLLPDDLTD